MASLPNDQSGLAGKRIVFCTPSGVQQLHLRHTLQKAGLVVVGEAHTGADALLLVGREQPDIVLLDTSLPDRNADEIARAILAVCPLCLVLITTDPQVADRAAQWGVSACLVKPFDGQTLLSHLRRALIPEAEE